MNLKALEYCVEIARQGSFTKAAQALHVAQPALSMAVSRLEDELGVALFNRATRQISVTAEGQLFLARAEECLEGLAGARRELQDLTQLHSGEIRVGVPPMYGIRHIPDLLMQFRAQYPGIAMHVVEGSADDISERLATRDIDVALLESRRVDPAWESVLLGSDEMVFTRWRASRPSRRSGCNTNRCWCSTTPSCNAICWTPFAATPACVSTSPWKATSCRW
jgi:LysR family transcriptional regulator, cyn operon transcriptional activator